jgi:hypothetical protein
VIGLIARRTLTNRPRRTLLLLFGFGISVGVMIVLLSIGEAVLDESRDKDIVGGGDLVILPAGVDVEVMKVGGTTGMFFALENARFVYRQLLSGPRYARWISTVPVQAGPPLAAASPAIVGKLVYVCKVSSGRPAAGRPVRALANGVIPDLERAARGSKSAASAQGIDWQSSAADHRWMEPSPDSLYDGMDHFHIPPASQLDLERWAEWLYFNFTDSRSGDFGMLSLMVAGDIVAGHGVALTSLQLARRGREPLRFQGSMPLPPGGISEAHADLRLGRTTAVFRDGAYRLHLDWASPEGRVRGDLVVRPTPDLYYPPFLIHSSERFLSGYTVPAIRTTVDGTIDAGGVHLGLESAPGYHDHNWGTWRDVHWDWGTASSPEYGLFYGRIEHPEIDPGRAGAGVFLMLSQARTDQTRGGMLGLFRPKDIDYTWRKAPRLPGNPARVPTTMEIVAEQESAAAAAALTGDRIHIRFEVEDIISTPPRAGASPLVFLQLHGRYRVRARIAGRDIAFETLGFAEVFAPPREP